MYCVFSGNNIRFMLIYIMVLFVFILEGILLDVFDIRGLFFFISREIYVMLVNMKINSRIRMIFLWEFSLLLKRK